MRVRKRDLTVDPLTGRPTFDMRFGHSAADYWHDVPDAPAQLVAERLALWEGQWFLDASEGLPVYTEILGRNTDATRDRAIRARITGTEGVTGISAYASQVDRNTRADATQAVLATAYGPKAVAVVPANADVRIYR